MLCTSTHLSCASVHFCFCSVWGVKSLFSTWPFTDILALSVHTPSSQRPLQSRCHTEHSPPQRGSDRSSQGCLCGLHSSVLPSSREGWEGQDWKSVRLLGYRWTAAAFTDRTGIAWGSRMCFVCASVRVCECVYTWAEREREQSCVNRQKQIPVWAAHTCDV